jgi:protein DEK
LIDLERQYLIGVTVKIFFMQPLPKSKKNSSKGNKKERNSSGMARKAKRTKCPEILSDESSSDEEEKKNKEESSDDEEKESEEEVKCSVS